MAGRSAAATCKCADCGFWYGFTRSRYADHFSSQRTHARSRVSAESLRHQGARWGRGSALHPFCAIGIARLYARAGRHGNSNSRFSRSQMATVIGMGVEVGIGLGPLNSAAPACPLSPKRMAAKCIYLAVRCFRFPVDRLMFRRSPEGVLQVDFNYDFKTDLVLAGAGGVRLFRQDSSSVFTDVTEADQVAEVRNQCALYRRVGSRH
jgi:hypothetical protein